LGRIGLLIHSTAGYVDPGWHGHLTLELSNVAKLPITLYREMKIGQVSFIRLTSPAENLYGSPLLGSKYQGQTEPTSSRYYQDFEGR
jgi:dCTP deaminase